MQAQKQQLVAATNQNLEPFIRPRIVFRKQLWTMVRHNLQLKGRAKKSLACEIIFPLLLFFPLFIVGQFFAIGKTEDKDSSSPAVLDFLTETPVYVPDPKMSRPEKRPNGTYPIPELLPDTLIVGFTPNNSQTQRIINIMKAKWTEATSNHMELIPFESDANMENYYHKQLEHDWDNKTANTSQTKFVGVVFNVADLSSFSYTIRGSFMRLLTDPPYISTQEDCRIRPWDGGKVPDYCDAVKYSRNGFLALQMHLSAAYIEFSSSQKTESIQLFTRIMPQPAMNLTGGSGTIKRGGIPGLFIAVILGTFVCFLVSSAVAEKEAGLVSHMQVMGLQPTVYWMAWSVLYFTFIFVVAIISVVVLKVLRVWSQSNLLLMFFYCLLYGLAMIALCWCIVPLVRRPLLASLFVFIVILTGGLMFILDSRSSTLTTGDRWGIGFLPSAAFTIGVAQVVEAEMSGSGVGFDTALPKDSYSFGASIFSLIIDIIVFGLVALYLEQVFPSDVKAKQPPWFFVLPSYWVKSQKPPLPTTTPITSTDIESVPLELRQKTAIISRNLRKDFFNKAGTAAVEDFTYEIYEDEILAVLGHNGAGKTTLLSMLVGLLKPTSGHAFIYGQDIIDPEQLKIAQTMIGNCPQHDVLFDTLTVKEHIIFYTRLKGFSDKDADKEYERVVDCINMRDQADNKARNLSGGQKRRLCIAIAIAGDPKVLMLDEPTSGVDPFTRSFIWDMIRTFKKGRCVIVTTHSMQEADVHCDRKLIFSNGRIRCAGTSLFLKNKFGVGYHLTMSVEREFSESQVTEFITSRIPSARTARVHGGEISFRLPKEAVTSFKEAFADLDKNLTSLKIRSYGIRENSLEEIFLKLAADLPSDILVNDPKSIKKADLTNDTTSPVKLMRPRKGAVSFGVKFVKLCKIRFLLATRSKIFWIFQFILPLTLLILVCVLLRLQDNANIMRETKANLPMAKVGAALKDTGARPASNQNAEKNTVVASMEALIGQKFDEIPYDQLNKSTPHYISFEFLDSSALSPAQDKNRTSGAAVVPPVTLVYNASVKNAVPYAANIILNAIFRNVTGREETFDFAIHPYPQVVARDDEEDTGLSPPSIFVGFVLLLVPGLYCVDVCRDRTLKLRSQIRMTSCPTWLYWGSAFASHLTQYIGTFILTIIVMYGFKVKNITENIGAVILLFLLHAPAVILFCYCLSFAFRRHRVAMAAVPFPLALAGLSVMGTCVLLKITAFRHQQVTNPAAAAEDFRAIYHVCVFLFPFYGFLAGLLKLDEMKIMNMAAKEMRMSQLTGFDWKTDVPVVFVAHTVHIVTLILLLTYLESVSFNQTWFQTLGMKPDNLLATLFRKIAQILHINQTDGASAEQRPLIAVVEEDVKNEQLRAQNANEKQGTTYSLLIRNLWKQYGGPTFMCRERRGQHVVRNVSILLPKGEILGLLGPNGAGKSTTLSMVVGEVTPNSGNVYVNGHDMRSETADAIESMGSCPQADTLWDEITMSEHLELFAALNDLPHEDAKSTLAYFVNGLAIKEHVRKKSAALSGGTKRKLTFMISMLGSPPLVLLDEPSTGMDPQSKRFLWDIVTQNFGGDRSAVLTTHSMEEADALCDRICIIVNGTMHCIGSSQHLKDKYGSGYVLEIRLSVPQPPIPPRDSATSTPVLTQNGFPPQSNNLAAAPNTTEIAQQKAKAEVLKMFPKAKCTEQHYNRMVFSIGREQISSMGAAFADLDKLKQSLGLEEYSFSQTTLEQVFLHFAAMQENQVAKTNQLQPPRPPFGPNQLVPSPNINVQNPYSVLTAQPSHL